MVEIPGKEAMESYIELMLDAALQHGLDSDFEHEVGDLQDLCRTMWANMTHDQRELVWSAHPMWESSVDESW